MDSEHLETKCKEYVAGFGITQTHPLFPAFENVYQFAIAITKLEELDKREQLTKIASDAIAIAKEAQVIPALNEGLKNIYPFGRIK